MPADAHPDRPDLISGRAAAVLLGDAGLAPAQAHVVLAAGLAGRPVQVGRLLGYDRAAVEQLVARDVVTKASAPEACRLGTLVLRVGRGHDPRTPWEPGEKFSRGWPIAASARWTLHWRTRREHVPCLVTAAGFVAAGADIVGVGVLGSLTYLTTADPGAWWTEVEGRRLPTGRGTSWTWWPPPPDTDRIKLERRQSRLRQA